MRFFFHVERFAAQGQYRLREADARLFCRAARRIPLDDEQLVEFRLFARARGEFAYKRKIFDGVFRARNFLCLARRDAHARRRLRLFDDLVKRAFQLGIFI